MAEYKPVWKPHFDRSESLTLGRYTLPTSVDLEAEGQKGAPDVHAHFEMRDGVPEVVEFTTRAKPMGRAVRTSDLNGWQPLEGLALNAFRLHAWQPERDVDERGLVLGPEDERDFWRLGGALHEAQNSRLGPTEAELAEVAQVYRAAIEGRPTEAVQVQMGYRSRRTAARRVQQAREAGLLPHTSRGKKQA
jgi:hypothetical protein